MNEQIDLSQLWNVFKRSFIAMILLGILGMGVAYFGAKAFIAPKYAASTSMLVNRKPAQYKLKPAKYSNLTEDDLVKKVSVSNAQNSQVFTVNVRDTDPIRARDIANEISKVFKEKIATIMSVSNVSVVSKAVADSTPVSPRLKLMAIIGPCHRRNNCVRRRPNKRAHGSHS